MYLSKIATTPELITLDCFGTLIYPSQSVGRWYRKVLNDQCGMRIRLPPPALFTAAFNKTYADMVTKHTNFGATSAMSSRDWWYATTNFPTATLGALELTLHTSTASVPPLTTNTTTTTTTTDTLGGR
jgi:hypothetical protein